MKQKNKTIFLLLIFLTVFFCLYFSFAIIKEAKAQFSLTTGMVVYGKGSLQNPKYKIFDGTNFGAEQSANSVGTSIDWVLVQGIPLLRNEKIMGTVGGGSKTLTIQRWNGTVWTTEWTANVGTVQNRNFAIAYERKSGNALVIYGNGTTQLKYREWNGTSWTAELNAGNALTGAPQFLQAVSRPTFVNSQVNDFVVMVTTSDGKLHALRWNNNTWGDQVTMTSNPSFTTSDVANVAYERSTGHIMVVWGTADNRIVYRKFTTAWQAETTAYSGLPGVVRWLEISADRLFSSARVSLIWNDTSENIRFGMWNGSSWETQPDAVPSDQIDKRNVSTAWEKHNGKAMFVFAKKSPDGKVLSWRNWTPATGFGAVTSESGALTQKIRWLKIRADAKSNNLLVLALDIGSDLSIRKWNGTSWDAGFTSINVGGSSAGVESFDYYYDDFTSDFDQNYFRWYADNDQLKPTDPWSLDRLDFKKDLGEKTAITSVDLPPATGESIRLRMSLKPKLNKMVVNEDRFVLQFTQKTMDCILIDTANWSLVDTTSSAVIWRGVNGTPVAGTALSTDPPFAGDLVLSVSDRAATYEEGGMSALNPYETAIGEDVEYDWLIQNNGALPETNYCFRMLDVDGAEPDDFIYFPQLITSGYRARSQNWRWFTDENNETPAVALANENTAPTGIENQNILKLRLAIAETATVAGTDIKFKLQFSENSDFSQGVYDVVEKGDCALNSVWCYADGIDQDDALIITRKLSDSVINGRHNESGISSSTLDLATSSIAEVEFTIKPAGPRINTTYYFRAYNVTKDTVVLTNSGETYPNLVTEEAKLSFTISGLPAGTSTEGIVTDITTTATGILFDTLGIQTQLEGAQRLTVTTNATDGYQIFIYQDQGLLNGPLEEIKPVAGTNAVPTSWKQGCVSTEDSCYGYHSSDSCLFGCSDRFASDDTYAQLEITPKEIAYNSYPVTNETIDVVFKIQVSPLHPAGTYSGAIRYIIIPYF